MRIRRRPLHLSLSSSSSSSSFSLSSDPCLQQPAKEERVAAAAADGVDPPLVQDLLPNCKSNPTEGIIIREEEKEEIQVLDDQKTLDSHVTSDKRSGATTTSVLLGWSRWCNGETSAIRKRRSAGYSSSGGGFGNGDEVVKEEKKRKRTVVPLVLPNIPMEEEEEGSSGRCSRVNGRGWRCSQQTPVGYSLCEHHLGKGRRRITTMKNDDATNSIRGGGRASRKPETNNIAYDDQLMSAPKQEEEEEVNKKTKKKMKARSITSLLDETDHLAAATLSSLIYHHT